MALSEKAAPGRGAAFQVQTSSSLPYRMIRATAVWLVRTWFRPRIEGLELVPTEGPVILAPVHRSFADFSFSGALTDRKLFFMAKDNLWRSRLLGWFLVYLGAFPVHRGAADREAMANSEAILRADQVLLMFPEGTRKEGPKVQELFDGVAFVAARTGATIVPVGIGGSDVSMPKGTRIPKRIPITVAIGPPLPPPARTEGGRVTRSAVRRTTEELRGAIQAAYDRALEMQSGASGNRR